MTKSVFFPGNPSLNKARPRFQDKSPNIPPWAAYLAPPRKACPNLPSRIGDHNAQSSWTCSSQGAACCCRLASSPTRTGWWQAGGQEAGCLRVDMATSNHLTTLRWPLSLLKNSEHPPIKSLDCFPPKTVGRLSFVLWQNYLSLCSTLCDKIIPEFSGW